MRVKLFAAAVLAALVVGWLSMPAQAENPHRRIEGTWLVQLTMRNCADETPISSGFGLNTFIQGGTMLGTPSAPPAVVRTGHGVWSHIGGDEFTNQMTLFTYNPQTGALSGLQVVSRRIALEPAGDEFSSRDIFQQYDPATLTPIGPQGCATGAGRRMP